MTAGIDMTDNLFHTPAVITGDAVHTFVGMVHDDGGNTAGSQTDDAGGFKISLNHDDTVQAPLTGVLVVDAFGKTAPADEGKIITIAFCFQTELVEKRTEIFMIHPVFVDDADVVGLAGLQRSGGGIGIVTHILGRLADECCSFPAVTG